MSLLITVPNLHWMHTTVCHALMKLQMDSRYRMRFEFPSHRPYENNLHHIVNSFMAGDYEYWLNIDADNAPMKNPLDLVALDKDIVGLPTPIWHYEQKPGERPIAWNAFDWDEEAEAYREHAMKRGLRRVDGIGTGCFLIARRVFDDAMMRKGPFQRRMAHGVNRDRFASGVARYRRKWLGMRQKARSDTRKVSTCRTSFSSNSP